jgi:predicted porin
MKKSLLALAALSAFATAAQAQSSVTVYGVLDVNYSSLDSSAAGAGSATAQGKNSLATSRLGFKGDEDLGGGLKTQFQLEAEMNPNTGAAASTMFGREAWVGFASAKLGSVRVGTTDVTSTQAMDSTVSQLGDLGNTSGDIGADKGQSIRYTTPTFAGFTAQIGHSNALATTDYTTDATSSATAAGKITSAYVEYVQGQLGVYAGQSTAKTTATYDRKDTKFGVKYDFGFASVGALRSTVDAMGVAGTTDGDFGKLTQTVISAAAPLAALGSGVKVHAAYHKTDSATGDRSTTATTATATDIAISDSKKTTLAMTKAFSKRTTGYVAYIDTNFDAAAKADTKSYVVGVNHTF